MNRDPNYVADPYDGNALGLGRKVRKLVEVANLQTAVEDFAAEQTVYSLNHQQIRDVIIGGRKRAGKARSRSAAQNKARAKRRAKGKVAKRSRKVNR